MGLVTESTVPDPRGTDHERALFLDLLWDDTIDAHVKRRTDEAIEKEQSSLMAKLDDKKASDLKFVLVTIEGQKKHYLDEGRVQGALWGFGASVVIALLLDLAKHWHRLL